MKRILVLAILFVWMFVFVFNLNFWIAGLISLFLIVLIIANILSSKDVEEIIQKEKTIYEEKKILIFQARNPNSKNLTDGNEYIVRAVNKGRALIKNDKGRKEWYSIKSNFVKK